MNWTGRYRKALTFSFDDGNESDIRLVALFREYGMKCTFNLNSGLGQKDTWAYRGFTVRRLDLADAQDVYRGHEIAVHGSRHLNLTELSPEACHAELAEDKAKLTSLFGSTPVGMAYAYGAFSDAVVAEVRSLGLRYARGVASTYSFAPQTDLLRFCPTCHHDDPQVMALAEQFLSDTADDPQIFYIWGHSYELEIGQGWEKLERLLNRLAGHSQVFYGTNAEVLL